MRNSSLVKRFCAENVTGLKLATEATETASCEAGGLVGERRVIVEAVPEGAVEVTGVRMLA